MRRYFDLLSSKSLAEIEALFTTLKGGANPKSVKSLLAMEMVERFHSKIASQGALEHFEKVVSRKEVPDDLPEVAIPKADSLWLPKLLVDLKFCASTSEGKRMVAQGGVKIDSQVVQSENFVPKADTFVLQCGKRKYARLKLH